MMVAKTSVITGESKERRMRRNEGRGHVVKTVIASTTISQVSLLNKDVYVCNATNDAGSVQQKLRMHVHPEPKKPCKYRSFQTEKDLDGDYMDEWMNDSLNVEG